MPDINVSDPQIHLHNRVNLDGSRGWNILVTLLAVADIVVIGWKLSLGPWAEITAGGIAMFLTTLVSYMFKAGILRLPERSEGDDLALTKSTLFAACTTRSRTQSSRARCSGWCSLPRAAPSAS